MIHVFTQNKYIITGGPGAGKTSLLESLKERGFFCLEEASRQLITELVAAGSPHLPWLDLATFAEKVLERMVQSYQNSGSLAGPIFFDRGIPDIVAYLSVAGLPVDDCYGKAVRQHPYNPLVFILPPWKEIYVNDAERWQTFEEAAQLYTTIKKTYRDAGYSLVEVTEGSVDERAAFVLNTLQDAAKMDRFRENMIL